MNPDLDKIDDAVLALLYLTSTQDKLQKQFGTASTWKSHDWDAMSRLHEKDLISTPVNKNKSVMFTEEGYQKARSLFEQMFCRP